MPTGSYKFDFIPANVFSYQELTEAYNNTRVDYIVPMPMNADRLREYVETYDVDLAASAVAVDGNEVLGLGMLGVREGRTWITRLGITRSKRRRGAGGALVDYLIEQAQQKDKDYIIIEVIEDNLPAYSLFVKNGFKHTRDLLVLRRPPIAVEPPDPEIKFQTVEDAAIPALLRTRRATPSWLDEYESLINAGNLFGLEATFPNGNQGWLIYQDSAFQLARLVIQTEHGDPVTVGRALLQKLHHTHDIKDTKTENLPANDPHWPAFQELGYMVSFRRNEMKLQFKKK